MAFVVYGDKESVERRLAVQLDSGLTQYRPEVVLHLTGKDGPRVVFQNPSALKAFIKRLELIREDFERAAGRTA